MRKGRLVVPERSVLFNAALVCLAIQLFIRCLSIDGNWHISPRIPFVSDAINYFMFYGGSEYAPLIAPYLMHDLLTLAYFVLTLVGVLRARKSLMILSVSWILLAVIPFAVDITTYIAVACCGYGEIFAEAGLHYWSNTIIPAILSALCCVLVAVLLILINKGIYKNKIVPIIGILAVYLLNYGMVLFQYLSHGYFLYFLIQLVATLSGFMPAVFILLSMYNLYTPVEMPEAMAQRLNPYQPPEPYEQEVTLPNENIDQGE